MTETLEGQLERVVYSNDDNLYTVARLKVRGNPELITVVGNLAGIAPGEMLKLVGERGVNLERAILVREGRRRKHDLSWHDYYYRLFKRWLSKEKLESVMDEYYETRGWNIRTGIPTKEKLEELGLGDVAHELSGLTTA